MNNHKFDGKKKSRYACFQPSGHNYLHYVEKLICDMIKLKGNESDVRNIEFKLQAFERWQFLMVYIVFEPPRIVHISVARCLIEMEFKIKM